MTVNRNITGIATASMLAIACATEPDCAPEAGFELGMGNAPMPDACQSEDFIGSYRLGEALSEMRDQRRSLMDRENELDARERARLRVLERDIPELETLARLRGLMEPAKPEE